MAIDLTPDQGVEHPPTTARRYSGLVVFLAAALALTIGLLVGFVRPHTAPATPIVRVGVGLSAYPADVTAAWWDRGGHRGTLDPWNGQEIRLAATRVVVAVAFSDGPVQCTITINGAVVDSQAANAAGQVAVCAWAA